MNDHARLSANSLIVDEGITAETDHDAIAFYRRYGFEIQSLGEKYPGVER